MSDGNLSTSERNGLWRLGWRWAMATPDSGEWLKFTDRGTCEAQQGDLTWIADLKMVGPDTQPQPFFCSDSVMEPTPEGSWEKEGWTLTMELRFQVRLGNGEVFPLQQKWVRGGITEWRDVGYVDEQGVPFA